VPLKKDGAEVTAHPRPAFQPRKVPVAEQPQDRVGVRDGQHRRWVPWFQWCREDVDARLRQWRVEVIWEATMGGEQI
jgi:hypothetical protein